jgi:vancomycin resistance protein YoaR
MKKILITAIIIATLGMVSVPVAYVHATEGNWSDVIYPGVYIEDIDLSGKQRAEAERLINKKYQQAVISKKIQIIVNDKIYALDYNELDAKYNVSEVVDKAYSYGKEGNLFKKYRLIKSGANKEFKLSFTYDAKPIETLLDTIDADLSKEAVDAKISIITGDIRITPEINREVLLREELKEMIIEHVNGELAVDNVDLTAPIEVIRPEITAERLSAINKRVSSFSTDFSTSIPNRINNIELSTRAINGTLLMPGETFSFNNTVGQRTLERGYKEAGVIVGDRFESGIGGGICQVSSTLYNAALLASLKSTERVNHTLPLTYVEKGLDATVDWGNIDYKFKNTLDYPIYIEGYTENGKVFFNIYSNEEITNRTYKITTDIHDIIKPNIKYIEDPELYEGESEVIKAPADGYRVRVYRQTYENGVLVNNETISNDYYFPVNGIIRIGTKEQN